MPIVLSGSWGLVVALLTGLATMLIILAITPLAKQFRLLDSPDGRKNHQGLVPMVGGLAIYIVNLAALLIMSLPDNFFWLMLSGVIIVAVGTLDDAYELGVMIRLASQFLATIILLVASPIWIQALNIDIWALEAGVNLLGLPLTIFAVIGLTNGFNMADGIDGLASGHILVGLASIGTTLYITQGYIYHLEWFIVLVSSVFTFWLINMSLTPFRKIFLGDAGSALLGFVMAWILIYYSQEPIALIHPIAALWCVSVPVLDMLVVIAKRVKNGKSPFLPDRNHLHYILVDLGVNPRAALFMVLLLAIGFNALGIWITYAVSPQVSLVMFICSLFVFYYGMSNRSLQEKIISTLRVIE
jgi:undecaprenyl-phosphate alpha-N-acetylglucosaminyl 1-phosphatetransferase